MLVEYWMLFFLYIYITCITHNDTKKKKWDHVKKIKNRVHRK